MYRVHNRMVRGALENRMRILCLCKQLQEWKQSQQEVKLGLDYSATIFLFYEHWGLSSG